MQDIARQDYNVVAWMLGGQDPRRAELRAHQRAIAAARSVNTNSFLARVRQAVDALDPRPSPITVADCCAA
jgi:hypothetical protein